MLFDDEAKPPLIGIARLASESQVIEAKRQVEYLDLETRNFIGKCSGSRMRFVWTVNPYRGCEFGCKYCYARFAHEFMEQRDPLAFERKIYAKKFSAAGFRAELKKVQRGQSIWIGTATDPYQPAERRYGITREIFRVLAGEQGLKYGVATKSDLVARDADLFAAGARANVVHINVTITTVDEKLARLLEPFAPRPSLRLRAVEKLAASGVRVTVLAHPVMPLINDSDASLDAVCASAVHAGARSFSAAPVFLKPCAQKVFYPFLEEHYPHLVRRYRERFERGAYLKGDYPEQLRERITKLIKKYRLTPREEDDEPPNWPEERQLTLFS